MKKPLCTYLPILYAFLHSTEGNWRNSIYITCCSSSCKEDENCCGFLFVPDADGSPILMPISIMRSLVGYDIEKEECLGIMTKERFLILYSLWLDWNTETSSVCVLQQIMDKLSGRNNKNKLLNFCSNVRS